MSEQLDTYSQGTSMGTGEARTSIRPSIQFAVRCDTLSEPGRQSGRMAQGIKWTSYGVICIAAEWWAKAKLEWTITSNISDNDHRRLRLAFDFAVKFSVRSKEGFEL